MRAQRLIRAALSLSLAGAAGGVVAGCSTYTNYPQIASDVAVHDNNIAPTPELMRRALVEVIGRDVRSGALSEVAGGRWTVNFPEGMERDRAMGIVQIIESALLDSNGAIVGERGADDDAVLYSVTRVWLRGDTSLVEVIRPTLGDGVSVDRYGRPMDSGPGDTGFQRIEVRMRSGFKPWTVVSVREWTPGLAPVPTVYGWPEAAAPKVEGAGEGEADAVEDEPMTEEEV